MQATFKRIDNTACEAYAELGAICLRGVFDAWIDLLRRGVERNHDAPGKYFSENVIEDDAGRFWDDYCNWERIPEYRQFVTESNAAQLAAQVMRSGSAQFFHDHVLAPGCAVLFRRRPPNSQFLVAAGPRIQSGNPAPGGRLQPMAKTGVAGQVARR